MQTAFFVLQNYSILVLFALVIFGAGRQLLHRLDFRSPFEEISFSVGLGMGVFGSLIFALGLVRLIYWQSVAALLFVMALASLPAWRSVGKRLYRFFRGVKLPSNAGFWVSLVLLGGVVWVVLWPMVVKPLFPPHQWDAISYHLAVAKSYATNHSVDPLPHLRFCVFPQLMNMLFAAMLLLADDVAAQLVSFLAMLLTASAVLGWGHRRYSFRTGVLAAALFLGSPMILFLGSSAYIDMGLTMFVTLAILAFFNWRESRHTSWLVLSGAMTGFAAGTKYTGAFLALAFLSVLLFQAWKEKHWRLAGLFLFVFLLTAGPWYVRNVAYTSDPFFPMLGRSVPNPCWDSTDAELQANDLVQHGPERTGKTFLRLPWDLAFNQRNFFLDFGTPASKVVFILLPLTLLLTAMDPLARRLMMVVFAYTTFWFLFAPLLRYLQPIIPLWSLATAAALDRFAPKVPRSRLHTVILGVVICGLFLWYGRSNELPRNNPLPVTEVQRDIYLSRFSLYPCYQWLNRHRGSDYRVYNLGDEYMAYFADGVRLGDLMGPGRYRDLDLSSAQGLYHSLRRLRIDYLMTSEIDRLAAVRADPHFSRHFQLVCGGANAIVWRLTERGVEATRGGNLVFNPGLEDGQDSSIAHWGIVGNPRLDVSGTESHEGKVAVRADRQNFLFPTVPVIGDQLYELRFWARAEEKAAEVRLEFHWLGDEGLSLGAFTELFEVGPEWTELVLPLTSPLGATLIVIHPHTSGEPAWFDVFSMRQVFTSEPSRSGTPALSGSTGRPQVMPVTRRVGEDGTDVFSVTVTDPDGAEDIAWVEVILNDTLRRDGGCYLRITGEELNLLDDDGIQVTGRLQPGNETIIENGRCRIDGGGLVIRRDATLLQVDVPIVFNEKSEAPLRGYGRAQDVSGQTFFWEAIWGRQTSSSAGELHPRQ